MRLKQRKVSHRFIVSLKQSFLMLLLISFFSSNVLIYPNTALANDNGAESEGPSNPGKELGAPGRKITAWDQHGKPFEVIIYDSPKSALNDTSPENLARQYKALPPPKKGNIFKEVAKQFVPESIMFFFAIGLVQSMTLVTSYHSNPMALDQHVDSLTDPVAHLSFYVFMLANRAVSPHLMNAISDKKGRPHPKLVHFVPYLGMTVGMMASHLTTELLTPIKYCVSDLMDKNRPKTDALGNPIGAPESCTKAYEDFVLSHKILDMVPGLTSMLASTFISGKVQQKLAQYASSSTVQAVKQRLSAWGGIKLGLSMTPQGGLATRFVGVLMHIGQLTLFVGLDHIIIPALTGPWNNISRGIRFNSIQDELMLRIEDVKANGWKDIQNCDEKIRANFSTYEMDIDRERCDRNLKALLEDFSKKMAEWRELNLSSVRIAQSGWESKTKSMFDSYFGAKEFYTAFIDQANAIPSKLDEFIPLYGILSETEYFRNNNYDNNPNDFLFVFSQFSFLAGLREFVLNDPGFSMANLNGKQKEEFQSLLKQFELKEKEASFLNSNATFKIIDIYKIWNWHHPESQALYYKYASLLKELDRRINQNFQNSELKKHYQMLKDRIGEHQPRMVPGEHFVANLPTKNLEVLNRYQFTGVNGNDYLVLQMICGPSSRETDQIFSVGWGFKDSFNAPRIIEDSIATLVQPLFCDHKVRNNVPKQYIYSQDYKIQKPHGNKKTTYRGALSIIRNNIKSEVIGNQSLANFKSLTLEKRRTIFDSWWNNKLLNPLLIKVDEYQDQYSKIISNFLSLMNKTNDLFDKTNNGPISNSPLISVLQEYRFYLTLLGEVIDAATNNDESLQRSVGLNTSDRLNLTSLMRMNEKLFYPGLLPGAIKSSKPVPFLQSLIFNPASDFENLVKSASDVQNHHRTLPTRSFEFQMRLDQIMLRYQAVFAKLKAQPAYGRELQNGKSVAVLSPKPGMDKVQFYKIIDLDSQGEMEQITKDLETEMSFLQDLFLGEQNPLTGESSEAKLSVAKEHQELIRLLLAKIADLGMYTQNYAQIIKAINFGDGETKPEALVPTERPRSSGGGSLRPF